MEKCYLFQVYTFCKSQYLINVGPPYIFGIYMINVVDWVCRKLVQYFTSFIFLSLFVAFFLRSVIMMDDRIYISDEIYMYIRIHDWLPYVCLITCIPDHTHVRLHAWLTTHMSDCMHGWPLICLITCIPDHSYACSHSYLITHMSARLHSCPFTCMITCIPDHSYVW